MTAVEVTLGDRGYQIKIGRGLLHSAGEEIVGITGASSAVLLSHPHIASRYAQPVMDGLCRTGIPTRLICIPSGERSKSLNATGRIYQRLLGLGIDRKSVLIALGGGVVGDLGGFVAATYLRGIAFIQIPTTLLAQVDASVGGKTGIDLPGGKNLVGAFHQPKAVLIDTDTLATLPLRELRAGLAEVIKYGIIRDKGLFDRTSDALPDLLKRDREVLEECIVRSCAIKAEIVAADETEQGVRAILNFGHTVGHALEAVTGFRRYKHGEAVAIGMVSAALIGEEVGVTPKAVTERIVAILVRAGLPFIYPDDIAVDCVLEAMVHDKKSVGGKPRFVLAKAVGDVVSGVEVDSKAVAAALRRQSTL